MLFPGNGGKFGYDQSVDRDRLSQTNAFPHKKQMHISSNPLPIAERNALVIRNKGLALKIANRLLDGSPLERDDLVQLCYLGLLKAVERFKPEKGVAFSSFAVPYIEGEVQHWLRDHYGSLKIPRRAFEASASVKRIDRLLQKRGRAADSELIAEACGMNADRWAWTQEAVARKPLTNIDDCLHMGSEDADLEQVERDRLKERLMGEIAKLPELKQACLLEFYFGQQTEEQIARKHSKTPEEIHTLLVATIATLTKRMSHANSQR